MGKLTDYYHNAKFDICHIYSVRENRDVKVFATYGQSAGRPDTDHYIDIFHASQKLSDTVVTLK